MLRPIPIKSTLPLFMAGIFSLIISDDSCHEFRKLHEAEDRQADSGYSYTSPAPETYHQTSGSQYEYAAGPAAASYAAPSRYPYPTYAQSVYTGNEYRPPVYQYQYPYPVYPVRTSTVPSTACRTATSRTNLGCYCTLIGQHCLTANSVCISNQDGDPQDGTCGCVSGYVAYNYRCITTAAYNNITNNGTASHFVISGPTIIASCFLPINGVLGRVAGAATGDTYTLTLLNSAPLGDSTNYIGVDPATGNLLYKILAPAALTNQVYQLVVTQPNGHTANQTITIAFNCTGPTCYFDLGNSQIVDCLRYTIGDTVVRLLVNGTVPPTFFTMSLIDSSSQNGNTFFRIDSSTGQVILQKMPHGGVFVEQYSVSAINGAFASCPAQILTLTTTETCV